jgi:hypothetical protein
MSPEELEALDGIVKKHSGELVKSMIRMYGIIFGLGGWVTYCHWHVAPAVVAWTLGALFFLVSYKKELR